MNRSAFYIPVFYLLFFSLRAAAQIPLVFIGNVIDRDSQKALGKVNITAHSQDYAFTTTIRTNAAGNYTLELSTEKPAVYTVEIWKKDYIQKTFIVSTENIPDNQRGTKFPYIKPNLSLFKPVQGVDYSSLKKPLLKYYYDRKKDNYVYDSLMLKNSLLLLQEIEAAENKAR